MNNNNKKKKKDDKTVFGRVMVQGENNSGSSVKIGKTSGTVTNFGGNAFFAGQGTPLTLPRVSSVPAIRIS